MQVHIRSRKVFAALSIAALVFSRTSIAQSAEEDQLTSGPTFAAPAAVSAPAATAAVDRSTPWQPPALTVNKRAENAELLKDAQKKLEAGDASNPDAAQTVAVYTSVAAVLAQQETVESQIKDLAARKAEVESQLQTVRTSAAGNAQPVSFIDLDQRKDQLNAEQARQNLAADKLTAATAALDRAQHELDDSQRKLRQAQAAVDANQDGMRTPDLMSALAQAKQTANLSAETTTLRQKQLARQQLDQQVQKMAVDLLQEQVNRASQQATFSDSDLKQQLTQIGRQEDALEAARKKAQDGLISTQAKVDTLRKQYRAATGSEGDRLGEMLDAHKFARDELEAEVTYATGQLSRLANLRLAWNERFQLANHKLSSEEEESWAKMKEWQAAARATLDGLTTDNRSQILQMVELRTKLVNVSKRADDARNRSPENLKWIEQQRAALDETMRLYETNMMALESSRRVHEKLLEEIGHNVDVVSPTQLALGTFFQFKQIWNRELFHWGDSTNPKIMTVSTAITGIGLFIAGMIFSRLMSSVVANRLLHQFHLSRDAASAIRSLAFYSLTVGVVLCVLDFMEVPMTAFTVFGGAMAIGVGFGSQAVINNFIGGLIMLAERPARIGERIVFGSHDGVVEEVGFRSTKLRTGNDHLVTIPNSTLVHESIENVGRRRSIRRTFQLAIACETSRESVAEAVDAVRAILEEPSIREPIHPIIGHDKFPPRVHFQECAADSFNLQVVYWYAPPNKWEYLDHAERINFRILEEFERLGVKFASPARIISFAPDVKQQISMNLSPAGKDVLGQPSRRAG